MASPAAAAAHVFVADLETLELDEADSHHLSRSLRLQPGEAVTASDGAGGWRLCRFAPGPALEPDGPVRHEPRPKPEVTVGFALAKGERPEWATQKLTEVGVDHIVPLLTSRTVVRWDADRADRNRVRLTRVAREAAMQSRRTWLPEVGVPVSFARAAEDLGRRSPAGPRPPDPAGGPGGRLGARGAGLGATDRGAGPGGLQGRDRRRGRRGAALRAPSGHRDARREWRLRGDGGKEVTPGACQATECGKYTDSVTDDLMPSSYAQRVGERLRAVRKQKRLSLQAVEAESNQEFKASVLGAYERGERSISVPRLQRLARFYNVPVDQLLPREVGPEPAWSQSGSRSMVTEGTGSISTDSGSHTLMAEEDGKVTIDLTALERVEAPERDLLRRYLAMIQVQRQDFNGRVLTIRGEDIRALGLLMDITPDDMRHRLDALGLRLHA